MRFAFSILFLLNSLVATQRPDPNFQQGYPLCSSPGYTQVPGPYIQTTHQQENATLRSCFNECKEAYPACKSLAYHARYTLCLWYNAVVNGTQLIVDKESEFVHWDLGCWDSAAGVGRALLED